MTAHPGLSKPCMLVTGGSGYLGKWIVTLARSVWDVTATYLDHPPDPDGDDRDVAWRRLGVRDETRVMALVREASPAVIVHAAALNPGQGTDFHTVNVTGTRHVARAAAAHRARLIHISTDVVFDGEKGNYVEDDPLSRRGRRPPHPGSQPRKRPPPPARLLPRAPAHAAAGDG